MSEFTGIADTMLIPMAARIYVSKHFQNTFTMLQPSHLSLVYRTAVLNGSAKRLQNILCLHQSHVTIILMR